MSHLITGAALYGHSEAELAALERIVRAELEAAFPGSADWHKAVNSLETLRRALAACRQAPKPPGF